MPDVIVQFTGVTKSYRVGRVENPVLHGVDLRIDEGEFVGIVGTSGSGKSTLLNIIGGLDRGYSGHVRVCGRELDRLSDRELSRFRNEVVGFIFQQFNLLEHLSCLENVAVPAMFGPSRPPTQVRERAREMLSRVGIADKAEETPASLSGGQKQRVAIARALFGGPKLLLCDEPTGNLDTRTGRQIIELFQELNGKDRISLIIVTHEARVSEAAHRLVRIEDGRIVERDDIPGVGAKAPEEQQA